LPTVHTPGYPSKDLDRLLALIEAALSALEELPQLDSARYKATHTLYEAMSDQRERIIDELCVRIGRRRPSGRPLRVLSVGCGGGDVDISLARTIAANVGELVYVGVDPNRSQCDAMKKLFIEADIPGVRFEVEVKAFEDFDTSEHFDVIHFVHSLYYVPDPAIALARARRMLTPDGELVVVQAPRDDMNELAGRFYDKTYERPTLFACDLEKLLTRWSWTFEQVRLTGRLDVTAFLDGESEVGTALRDFIVQIDGRSLPGAVQDLIARYLRLIAFQHEGRSFIAHPADALFISR
jgi:SAM-dependent methyltransferase